MPPNKNQVPVVVVQVPATIEADSGSEMEVDSHEQLVPETIQSDSPTPDCVEIAADEQVVAQVATTKRKRQRKGESKTSRQEPIPTKRSWGSEVDDESQDEKQKEPAKKIKQGNKTTRPKKQNAKRRGSAVAGNTTEDSNDASEANVKNPKADKDVSRKSGGKAKDNQTGPKGVGKGAKGPKGSTALAKSPEPAEPLEEFQTVDDMKRHNIKVAASGRYAYIAIDPDFAKKGSIRDWAIAATGVLAGSGRSAKSVSFVINPAAPSDGKKKKAKSSPALVASFKTKEDLLKALGPIILLGYSTEVVKFRGGDGRTFMIPIGSWDSEPDKLLQAFRQQAQVEIESYGFCQHHGAVTDLVIQTTLPPGRNVDTIVVNQWRIKFERVGEDVCCCCGRAHNCFASDVACSNFTRG